MNKQITKLIIEANKYATEKHPIADDADSITKEIIVGNRIGESQRKLAELIVRECAGIAETAEPFKSSDLILSQFGLSHVIRS